MLSALRYTKVIRNKTWLDDEVLVHNWHAVPISFSLMLHRGKLARMRTTFKGREELWLLKQPHVN